MPLGATETSCDDPALRSTHARTTQGSIRFPSSCPPLQHPPPASGACTSPATASHCRARPFLCTWQTLRPRSRAPRRQGMRQQMLPLIRRRLWQVPQRMARQRQVACSPLAPPSRQRRPAPQSWTSPGCGSRLRRRHLPLTAAWMAGTAIRSGRRPRRARSRRTSRCVGAVQHAVVRLARSAWRVRCFCCAMSGVLLRTHAPALGVHLHARMPLTPAAPSPAMHCPTCRPTPTCLWWRTCGESSSFCLIGC